MNRFGTIAAAAGFVGSILLANIATTHYGMIPVGFGLVATAGTYFAGLTFILRDVVHDSRGRLATVGLIAVGAILSLLMAAPQIALASVAAFALSELADMLVYTPLRKRGYYRAAVASNIVGAVVDTVVFLWLASSFFASLGVPVWPQAPGQFVGKVTMTVVALAVVGVTRAVLRQPVRA